MKGISSEKQKVLEFMKNKEKSNNSSSTNKLLNFNKSASNSRNRIENKAIEETIPKIETEFSKKLKAKLEEVKLKTPKALINKYNYDKNSSNIGIRNSSKDSIGSTIKTNRSNSNTNLTISRNDSNKSGKSTSTKNKSINNYALNKTPKDNSLNASKSTPLLKNANEDFKQTKQLELALKIRESLKFTHDHNIKSDWRNKIEKDSNLSIQNDISMINTPNSMNNDSNSNTSSTSKKSKANKINTEDVKNRVKESMKKYVNRVTKNNDKVKNIVKFKKENIGSFTDTVSTTQGCSIIDRAKA